jgi:hypothetical protein
MIPSRSSGPFHFWNPDVFFTLIATIDIYHDSKGGFCVPGLAILRPCGFMSL